MNQSFLQLSQLSFQQPQKSETFKVTERVQGLTEQILDIYRTAPFGIITGTTSLFFMTMIYYFIHEMDWYIIALIESVEGYILYQSAEAIKIQFKLRSRLEKILKKRGYSDRLFKSTVYERCDVQTAKVATRKFGCLPKYLELSEKNKELRRM